MREETPTEAARRNQMLAEKILKGAERTHGYGAARLLLETMAGSIELFNRGSRIDACDLAEWMFDGNPLKHLTGILSNDADPADRRTALLAQGISAFLALPERDTSAGTDLLLTTLDGARFSREPRSLFRNVKHEERRRWAANLHDVLLLKDERKKRSISEALDDDGDDGGADAWVV